MRLRNALFTMITLTALTACGSNNYGTGGGGTMGGGGGGGGGGPVGSITVGSGIQFVSGHNGSVNPAVDTIPVGGTATWTWAGSLSHSVQSTGATSFASSGINTGSGTYAVKFSAPGTYHYDCAVHGQAMTGTLVVR